MADYRSLVKRIDGQAEVFLNDRKEYGYLSFLQRQFPSTNIYLTRPDLVIIGRELPIIQRSKYRFIQYLAPDDLSSKIERIDRLSPVLLLDSKYALRTEQLGFRRIVQVARGDIRVDDREYAFPGPQYKGEITLNIQRHLLEETNLVYGPNYLSILISPEQTLILFGERHERYEQKCLPLKGDRVDLPIEKYLSYLLDDNLKVFFDFYTEEDYWEFFVEKKGEKAKTTSEAFMELFGTFKDCLVLSRREEYCPYTNLQTHFIDLRYRAGVAELNTHLGSFARDYAKLEGKTIDDPLVKKLVDFFNKELKESQEDLKEIESGPNKYFERFFSLIQAEINTIAPPFAKGKEKLQERLNKLRPYLTTEFPSKAAKFLKDLEVVIQSVIKGKRLHWMEWRRTQLPLLDYGKYELELIDLYALARMMHQFNMAKRKRGGGSIPKNVVLYAGTFHTEEYRNFFVEMGYQELYTYGGLGESQCIRVPNYPELQSWFKPIVEPTLTPAQIEYYVRSDIPYEETVRAIISTITYWDPTFWARKVRLEVSQFLPPVTTLYPNERFLELQIASGKIKGDLAAKFIEEKGYVFPGIEDIKLRGPKSESKYLQIPNYLAMSPSHPYIDLLLAQKGDLKLIEQIDKKYLNEDDYFAIASSAMWLNRIDLFTSLAKRVSEERINDLYHALATNIYEMDEINLCQDERCYRSTYTVKFPNHPERYLEITRVLLEGKLINPATVVSEMMNLRFPRKEVIRWLLDQGYFSQVIEASHEKPYLPGPRISGEFVYAIASPKTNLTPEERKAWLEFVSKELDRTGEKFFTIIEAQDLARTLGDDESNKILEPYKW